METSVFVTTAFMRLQGELKTARALLDEAVAGWKEVEGWEEDVRAAEAMHCLGMVMWQQGEYDAATHWLGKQSHP